MIRCVSGEDKREASSPSFFNPHEILVVRDYVQALRENSRLRLGESSFAIQYSLTSSIQPSGDEDIGVITPYNAQGGKIRKVLNDVKLKKNRPGTLKVGSVEEFQGQVILLVY